MHISDCGHTATEEPGAMAVWPDPEREHVEGGGVPDLPGCTMAGATFLHVVSLARGHWALDQAPRLGVNSQQQLAFPLPWVTKGTQWERPWSPEEASGSIRREGR